MKTLIIAQILTSFTVLIWFDVLKINNVLKVLLGYKKWTSKVEMRKWYHRWIACYFCTSFWIGVLFSVGLYFLGDTLNAILLVLLNSIVSRIMDYLLGYKSYKN